MNCATKDHVSAIRDLLAFSGEWIEIAGERVKAHIERDSMGLEKSEFGLDNREEMLTATIIRRGEPTNVKDNVTWKGRRFRITEITPGGEAIETLSLEND